MLNNKLVCNENSFMNKTNEKMRTVLVGIAGSNNAFSLSLYNLKAFAYNDPEIRKDWDIKVIQSPLIGLFRRDELLSDLTTVTEWFWMDPYLLPLRISKKY